MPVQCCRFNSKAHGMLVAGQVNVGHVTPQKLMTDIFCSQLVETEQAMLISCKNNNPLFSIPCSVFR